MLVHTDFTLIVTCQVGDLTDVVPACLSDPIGRRVGRLHVLVQDLSPAQKEGVLLQVHLARALEDLGTHVQRKEQLVPLEEACGTLTSVGLL